MAFGVSAADFVSVDVDHVKDTASKQISNAQYVRAGKEIGGLQFGLQSRTARYNDNTGMFNSLELTAGKSVGGVTPFVGLGYDNAKNGKAGDQYSYGLVGATAGAGVGPGFALAGAKTRVNWDSANPKQTVVFGTYSVPVAKNVAVNLNVSRSYQTITEKAYGAGISVGF